MRHPSKIVTDGCGTRVVSVAELEQRLKRIEAELAEWRRAAASRGRQVDWSQPIGPDSWKASVRQEANDKDHVAYPLRARLHKKNKLHKRNKLYDELLLAVGKKFPDETRHQTALRYIREAEQFGSSIPSQEAKS